MIRFGGDEFIVVLENTRAEDAYQVAERIRGCTGQVDMEACGADGSLTLSIGLIEGPSPVNDLLRKADEAMYESKCNGRNRITVYDEQGQNLPNIDM